MAVSMGAVATLWSFSSILLIRFSILSLLEASWLCKVFAGLPSGSLLQGEVMQSVFVNDADESVAWLLVFADNKRSSFTTFSFCVSVPALILLFSPTMLSLW